MIMNSMLVYIISDIDICLKLTNLAINVALSFCCHTQGYSGIVWSF